MSSVRDKILMKIISLSQIELFLFVCFLLFSWSNFSSLQIIITTYALQSGIKYTFVKVNIKSNSVNNLKPT